MFTKNTNYLIPQAPSSANGVEILLRHHPDLLPGHYLAAANAPPVVHASTVLNRENSGPSSIPKTVKKDRHSKIYTAQGPRDRRVRLSIGIARKFFDLQEMLGFDKPSKTLDWLLTKSKAAIKELVQSKHKGSTSSSECELLSSAGNCETSENCEDSKGKDKEGTTNPVVPNLVKETRAKARARARERTREKMNIKQQINGARNMSCGFNNSIPVQNRNNQLDFFQLSSGINNNNNNNNNVTSSFHCPLTNEDLIHESIVIKRKTKSPSFFGFQQNVIVSRDSSSNYNTIPSGNAAESWDNVCSFTSQSNLYAILDQHKFINSNSNI